MDRIRNAWTLFHLQIYAEQLNDIINQREARRVRGEYLARVRQTFGFS